MSSATQRIVTSHKEAAKRATEYLARARNLKLKRAEALELVARVYGVTNWQTLNALAEQGKAPRLDVGKAALAGAAWGCENLSACAESILARLEKYYTDQGFREHPIFGREDWTDSVDEAEMDDASYWGWVLRRLEHVKALLPWDRDDVYSVQVCRAAGLDVDFDPNPELWVVASSEMEEFLDFEEQPSELALWMKLSDAVEERAKALLGISETFWQLCSLQERLDLVKKLYVVALRPPAPAFYPPKPEPKRDPKFARESFIANGFKPTFRPGISGEVMVKEMKAWDMPYAREHIINVGPTMRTEGVYEDSIAVIEVTPDGYVTLAIGDEYKETAVLVDSEEGRGTLRDAGFPC